jgi:hypothetical protein
VVFPLIILQESYRSFVARSDWKRQKKNRPGKPRRPRRSPGIAPGIARIERVPIAPGIGDRGTPAACALARAHQSLASRIEALSWSSLAIVLARLLATVGRPIGRYRTRPRLGTWRPIAAPAPLRAARLRSTTDGLCGQAPGYFPVFALFCQFRSLLTAITTD